MSNASTTSVKDVERLISQAQQAGAISAPARDIVVANLNTSAMALEACQGVSPEDLLATEATIVTFVVDASGSMTEAQAAVVESLNESVLAMAESKQAEAITLSLITFSDEVSVVFANQPVDQVRSLTAADYVPNGMTALYDALLDALTGAMTYEERLLQTGISTKVIVVVFSDGANNASRRVTEARVRTVAEDLGKRENWILAFVGFETYETYRNAVDYNIIAANAGFPAVLKVDLTAGTYDRRHALRQTFRLVSRSVIRASQQVIDASAAPADFFIT